MTQKQKNTFLYAAAAASISLLLLFFTPLGNFLRSDLAGTTSGSGEAGLYVKDTLSTTLAGTGAVLARGNLTSTGHIPVQIFAVSGTGSILVNSLSGVLTYNPAILSITEDKLIAEPSHKVDDFVIEITKDAQGKETGQLRFSVDKPNGIYNTPRERVATLFFSPKIKTIDTAISMNIVRLMSVTPTSAEDDNTLFLKSTPAQSNIGAVPLAIQETGADITIETKTTAGSGEVIKETRTMPDNNQYIKETWQEKDAQNQPVQHILETYKNPEGQVVKQVHIILHPDGSKTIDEMIKGGNQTTTYYDTLGREIQIIVIYPKGDMYKKVTQYDETRKLTEEWWYQNGRIAKHLITYQDGTSMLEEYTYNSEGAYKVTVTLTSKNGKKSQVENAYDKTGKFLSSKVNTEELELNDAFTVSDPSTTMSTYVPKETLSKSADVKVFTLDDSFTKDGGFITKGFELSAISKEGLFSYAGFLRPVEITLTYKDPIPAGKTLSNLTASYYHPYKKIWENVPEVNILKKQASSVTFLSLYPGKYALKGSSGLSINQNTNNSNSNLKPSPDQKEDRLCVPAAAFKDIEGHWGESYMDAARKLCIIDGKSTGVFSPEGLITRAELTKVAINAFKWKLSTTGDTKPFTDVQLNDWYAVFLASAKNFSIVNGYADGSFRPNNPVNRAEAVKILLGAAEVELYTFAARDAFFKDTERTAWYAPYVGYAKSQDIITGYRINGDTYFKPAQAITRAEAVKIIMLLLK